MRCVLIYNPASGRDRNHRQALIRQISEALSDLGHSVEIAPTTAPGSATLQTCDAVCRGAEIVFACGGDGTIHEVLQGLVSETGDAVATLGIIPLGSANALARHLHLSLDPVQAALQEIHGTPHAIPLGKLSYRDQIRYFVVMAGAGPDGALVYDLLADQKAAFGRMSYYVHAARLFATRSFRPFEVELTLASSNATETQQAVSVMAVRVGNLGGLFRGLADGRASLDEVSLRLLVLRDPAPLALPLWFVLGWLRLNKINPFLCSADVSTFTCRPSSRAAAHFQADGEWLGRIPIRVSTVPNALRILLPSQDLHLTHGRN